MADKEEHSLLNPKDRLHLEMKHNLPIGDDTSWNEKIIRYQTKMADWTMLLVSGALRSRSNPSHIVPLPRHRAMPIM